MVKSIGFVAFALVILFVLANCSKDDSDSKQIELGVWISTDKKDTLEFISQTNFNKSNPLLQDENYDYKLLSKDSIRIGYRGRLFIDIEPTHHKYTLAGNEMTIDFTNTFCFGFDEKVITYIQE